ncbi:MAG: peptidoglycan DD-metalloendopeptidase family protein [Algibacter sp.]|uniref:peptidoglycan DD-metalloendopeptidase family protein n=1 Tax=Algibacter sp. TaxID=1872428 RepID=UPI003299239C
MNFTAILEKLGDHPIRVMDASKYIPLNLSETNAELNTIDVSSAKKLGDYVNRVISKNYGQVAYGGYLEKRNIYKRSIHFNNEVEEERNIHLGMDLWCEVETPIYAPLNGTVHSFNNNRNYGDYGPTIILKHDFNGVVFYTLYGHLSLASITDLKVGRIFKQNEIIATLGDPTVNGDYPPHLHFQIIKDLGDFKGDYPGVCNKKDLEFYKNNCPNPELVLNLES